MTLNARLSQLLVAFTVEFDNEFEHNVPHRTSLMGRQQAPVNVPWLVSMVMWQSFMRYIPPEGRRLGEVLALSHLPLDALRFRCTRMCSWWKYAAITPATSESRPKPPFLDLYIRPTPGAIPAIEFWGPLTGEIERRWRNRFGAGIIQRLEDALRNLTSRFDGDYAHFMPILGAGMMPGSSMVRRKAPGKQAARDRPDLPGLLAAALNAFADEYQNQSQVSLAISANVLRPIGVDGCLVHNLPKLSGISKEAVSVSLSFLVKSGYAELLPDPGGGRYRFVHLTATGLAAVQTYKRLTAQIEHRWSQLDGDACRELRLVLEAMTADESPTSLLRSGMVPYPDCWRATLPPIISLPHHPMVTHRGGYPDGA